MTPSHTWPRLFVADDLAAGLRLTPAPEQAHYLLHVLRADNETPVRLFNARDGEWQGRLAISGAHKKQRVEILVGEQRRPQQAEPDLWLCGAPIKRAHFDFMIMKATELGVARIQPVLTARTQLRDVNVERCRAIAIEAAEQSERLSVPVILKPTTLEQLVAAWPQERLPVVCAEFGEAVPLYDALSRPEIRNAPAAILTGPEGGYTPEEMDLLRALPRALAVRLGPRILRADTAALAALTGWQAFCGDWRDASTLIR